MRTLAGPDAPSGPLLVADQTCSIRELLTPLLGDSVPQAECDLATALAAAPADRTWRHDVAMLSINTDFGSLPLQRLAMGDALGLQLLRPAPAARGPQ